MFKKVVIYVMCLVYVLSLGDYTEVFAKENNDGFWGEVSQMIEEYEEDNYFATMTVKIGETEFNIDGERIAIDDSNSVPYVENGRTMMPVRGLAEAVGADVSFDEETRVVTVEDSETSISMTIGQAEMLVNGSSVELLNAPEIKNDRTMLPVRDIAEALECEVDWNQETETAIFTRDLQTKRVIAYSEDPDTTGSEDFVKGNGMTIIQYDSIENTRKGIERIESQGIKVEPDYVRKGESMSWGISDIGSKEYYEQVDYASGSAVVAVIDSGIDYSHPYFNGKISGGYDIVNNDSRPEDQRGHGTHVASTVLDVAGFNSNIKIMPIKVFGNSDSTYSTTVAQAIDYAVDNGADVITMSLGGSGYSYAEEMAVQNALNRNIDVIAAAGNEALDMTKTHFTPGGIDGVITVTALDQSGNLASFSNYGEGIVEFAAPGVNIKGAQLGGGYCNKSGTSMATPHVAGVYALAKAVHPNMAIDEITDALKNNTVKNTNNSKYYGAGAIRINNLESHFVYVESRDVEVSGVTNKNAIISGKILCGEVEPEFVGVRVYSGNKYSDVYKTRFKNNGNNEMSFRCDLNNDADYILESGTDYEMAIFMQPAGLDYVSRSIKFKTEGEPSNEPEPTPEPKPIDSELRILPDAYPKGDIEQGNGFGLSGRIKSNYHITDVRSYILDSNKNIIQESSGWTTTQTYVIEDSKLDTGLKFGNLSPGTYYLRYYAEDESGNSVKWTSDAFNVVGKSPVVSELRILPENYPSGQITQGNSYGLSGRIKSNYHITDVRSYLLDENGNVLQESSGWTTTQTYVIENSKLDTGLKFQNLSPGKYYLKYTAKDESGNSVSWQSDKFEVVGNNSNSELRILPNEYPVGNIKKGKSFGLSGRIKSNCHITDVRAYMLDSNKNIIMEASGWTTTQTYVIEGSALDKGMKFNNLSTGGYYLKYVASDESGNTVSWTSEKFYVVD